MPENTISVEIPKTIENLCLPSPELVTYFKNLEERRLWLDMDVDMSYMEFERLILNWNKADSGTPVQERKKIFLYFFSEGGDLNVNNSFIDVIKISKTPIVAINMGIAYSAACFIYLACPIRYMLPKASFLLHSGSADGIGGIAQQVESLVAEYKRQVKSLKDYLIDVVGLPKNTVDKNMRGEWYVNGEEALQLGICHKIVDDIDDMY